MNDSSSPLLRFGGPDPLTDDVASSLNRFWGWAIEPGDLRPVTTGGFSGARVWQATTDEGDWAVRIGAPGQSRERLDQIVTVLEQAEQHLADRFASLTVPAPRRTTAGDAGVMIAGGLQGDAATRTLRVERWLTGHLWPSPSGSTDRQAALSPPPHQGAAVWRSAGSSDLGPPVLRPSDLGLPDSGPTGSGPTDSRPSDSAATDSPRPAARPWQAEWTTALAVVTELHDALRSVRDRARPALDHLSGVSAGTVGRSATIGRRRERLDELRSMVRQTSRLLFGPLGPNPARPVLHDEQDRFRTALNRLAWEAGPAFFGNADRLADALQEADAEVWPHQTVHGDLWTGQFLVLPPAVPDLSKSRARWCPRYAVLDFDAVRSDTVCCDLARVLESVAVPPGPLWNDTLDRYETLRTAVSDRAALTSDVSIGGSARRADEASPRTPSKIRSPYQLSDRERGLTDLLGASTTLIAAVNWLVWLRLDGRTVSDPSAMADHLTRLADRLAARFS